jgi:hypothetical protein
LEGERPITVADQNPPFGIAEHPAPGAALGVGVSLEAAHCVGQYRDHQALDGLRFGVVPVHTRRSTAPVSGYRGPLIAHEHFLPWSL